jgi:arsenite-transporting ATPase
VLKKPSGSPEAVQRLLPRLRDRDFTHVLLVTLPEATPIHEAMQLERDLARADIRPFAWVVNQNLTPLDVRPRPSHARPMRRSPARAGARRAWSSSRGATDHGESQDRHENFRRPALVIKPGGKRC